MNVDELTSRNSFLKKSMRSNESLALVSRLETYERALGISICFNEVERIGKPKWFYIFFTSPSLIGPPTHYVGGYFKIIMNDIWCETLIRTSIEALLNQMDRHFNTSYKKLKMKMEIAGL